MQSWASLLDEYLTVCKSDKHKNQSKDRVVPQGRAHDKHSRCDSASPLPEPQQGPRDFSLVSPRPPGARTDLSRSLSGSIQQSCPGGSVK